MGTFNNVLSQLQAGNISILTGEVVQNMNNFTLSVLNNNSLCQDKLTADTLREIIEISNIVYNDTDADILPLDDGVYDLALELYKTIDPNFQVGAIPIVFDSTQDGETVTDGQLKKVYTVLDDKVEDFLYKEELLNLPIPSTRDLLKKVYTNVGVNELVSKRIVGIKHNYPKLVGTLDKCKFVLSQEAIDKGVFSDANVKIFERDFIGKHIQSGLISPHRTIRGVISLKYDGVSIEADVTNMVVGARTRGDANQDIAADLTPILYGYKFPNAPEELWNQESIGMKFEAIITKQNLDTFNKLTGKSYKNCRTAIIGLLGRSDAYKYRDLITLVPLATSLEDITREEEIAFMNKYYQTGVYFMSAYVQGDYISVLYQVQKFVKEAEFLRDFINFMYDGVVFEYIDQDLIKALGRVNAINKYAMAIKFTPLKRLTTFRGYDWTVGATGSITPMILYDPVEFYGAIHNKSSGHSYERFMKLGLRVGDVIEVEYTNDVMPYVTKPDNDHNRQNSVNEPLPFISHCPCCGTELKLSDSGKNAFCPNIKCEARNLKRMVNMIQKLNMKDFAEARLDGIGAKSLSELFNLTYHDLEFLGEVMATKMLQRIDDLRTKPIKDYDIVGTLGFENIGRRKWKLIFAKYTLPEVLSMTQDQLRSVIVNIKGLGRSAAETIVSQLEFFKDDLHVILGMTNVIPTKGETSGKQIRFTGFRDKELVQTLQEMGHDADDKSSVTMNTDILLIPEEGHKSTKTAKADSYNMKGANIQIVPVTDFMDDFNKYLN